MRTSLSVALDRRIRQTLLKVYALKADLNFKSRESFGALGSSTRVRFRAGFKVQYTYKLDRKARYD
jgi:hypothetical protein